MLQRIFFSVAALSILLGATLAWATVTPAEKDGTTIAFELDPFASFSQQTSFAGSKRAMAVCVGIGKHKTFLGLYVYDAHGNCVAWDDLIASKATEPGTGFPDAVAVAWFPPENGSYTVEVVNFGGVATDKCELAVK